MDAVHHLELYILHTLYVIISCRTCVIYRSPTPDRWMLHRAAVTIADTNAGLREYQFQQCTTAIYNFWLYDLCDVYLECAKRVFYKVRCANC
jgi:valyl-tRNA synthetase